MHVYVCMYACMYVCMYVCMCIYIYIYIYIYTCVCICVCIYIYIYIYIYTHYTYYTYYTYIHILDVLFSFCSFVSFFSEQRTQRSVSVNRPNSPHISPSAIGPVASIRHSQSENSARSAWAWYTHILNPSSLPSYMVREQTDVLYIHTYAARAKTGPSGPSSMVISCACTPSPPTKSFPIKSP